MGHVWLGFAESQMRKWLDAAGFRHPERALHAHCRCLLGRCDHARRPHGVVLGAHPTLLPVALLRLSVRHLHGIDRGTHLGRSAARSRRPRGRRGSLPHAAARRRQRPSDDAAETGRRGSVAAHGDPRAAAALGSARHRARISARLRRRARLRIGRRPMSARRSRPARSFDPARPAPTRPARRRAAKMPSTAPAPRPRSGGPAPA